MEELERRKGVDRRHQERKKCERRSEDQCHNYKQLKYELKCKTKEIEKLKDEIHDMNGNLFGS